jgi:hypothetical protein
LKITARRVTPSRPGLRLFTVDRDKAVFRIIVP